MNESDQIIRCKWCGTNPEYQAYHDEAWGVPVTDDRTLFEFITLEGAQAGLSWITILRKKPHYCKVFAGFDPEVVAKFGEAEFEQLMADPGIVRNRLKIRSTIANAQGVLEIQREFGTFSAFIWGFVDGQPVQNSYENLADLPVKTDIALAMSKDLKKRGFRFVGPTICYAFMQAVGMVNDHVVSCHRYAAIRDLGHSEKQFR